APVKPPFASVNRKASLNAPVRSAIPTVPSTTMFGKVKTSTFPAKSPVGSERTELVKRLQLSPAAFATQLPVPNSVKFIVNALAGTAAQVSIARDAAAPCMKLDIVGTPFMRVTHVPEYLTNSCHMRQTLFGQRGMARPFLGYAVW